MYRNGNVAHLALLCRKRLCGLLPSKRILSRKVGVIVVQGRDGCAARQSFVSTSIEQY